jgi:hypothetical protein
MDEPQFVPPSGEPRSTEPPGSGVPAAGVSGSAPPQPAPPAAVYAAPVGVQSPIPVGASMPRRSRPWLIPLVVAGGLGMLALAGLVIVAVISATPAVVAGFVEGYQGPEEPTASPPSEQPLVDGEPGSPVAVEPLACQDCFDQYAIEFVSPLQGAYVAVGLPVRHANDSGRISVVADQRAWIDYWAEDRGTPDSCYFTYTSPPLPFTPDDPGPASDEWVYYAPSHSDADDLYTLRETSRTFATSDDAASHMLRLADAIDGCQEYSLPTSGYAAVVTPAPAMGVPDDVAAYGWVEDAGDIRYYAVDLQHGNVIVRISLFSNALGPSEVEFREFVETYAIALGDLEP